MLTERPSVSLVKAYRLFARKYEYQDHFALFVWQTYRDYELSEQATLLTMCHEALPGNEFYFKDTPVTKVTKKRDASEIT